MSDTQNTQSSSASVKVTGRGLPPSSIQTVQTSLDMFKASMSEAMGLTKKLVTQAVGSTEPQKEAVRLSEQGALLLEQGKTEQALAIEQQRRDIMARFGVDSSDPDSMLSKANKQLAVADQALMNMKPELDALKSVDPLTDPLKYLVAQFKMVGAAGKWNAAATARDTAMDIIADRQRLATSAQTAEPALTASALKTQAIGQAQVIKANADAAVQEIDNKTRLMQINHANTLLNWKQDALRGEIAVVQMQEQRIASQMALSLRQGQVNKDAATLASLNRVTALHGLQPFTSVELAKMGTPAQDAMLARAASRPTNGFGNSPPEAMTMVAAFNSLGHITRQLPAAGQFYSTFSVKAREAMNDPTFVQKYGKLSEYDQIEKAYKQVYDTWEADAARKSNDLLSKDNPRKMQAKTFAAAPELENNMIAKFVKSFPKGEQPQEKQVFDYAIGQIQTGKPRAQVVSELQEFFARGQRHQYETLGLGLLNYPAQDAGATTPGEISYTITPSHTGDFNFVDNILGRDENNRKLNVLNPAELNNALILILSRSSAQGPNRLLRPEEGTKE